MELFWGLVIASILIGTLAGSMGWCAAASGRFKGKANALTVTLGVSFMLGILSGSLILF